MALTRLLKVCGSLLAINVLLVVAFRFITNYHNYGFRNKKTIVLGIILIASFAAMKLSGFSEYLGIEEFVYQHVKDFFAFLKTYVNSFFANKAW